MAQSERENWKGAQRAFLEAVKRDNRNGEAWFDLAFAYIAGGDLTAAESAFRNSIVHKSIDSILGHNNVGVLLAIRGEYAAAEREFETALKASGGSLIEAKNNLEYCRAHHSERAALVAGTGFEYTGRKQALF